MDNDERYLDKIISASRVMSDGEVQEILEYIKAAKITKTNYSSHHLKTQKFLDGRQKSFENHAVSAQEARKRVDKELAEFLSCGHEVYVPLKEALLAYMNSIEQAAFEAYGNNLIYRPIVRAYWNEIDKGYKVGWDVKAQEDVEQDAGEALKHTMRIMQAAGIDVEAVIKKKANELAKQDAAISLLDSEFSEKTKKANALRLRKAIHEHYLNRGEWPGRKQVQNILPKTGKDVVEDALAQLIKEGQVIMQKEGNKNLAVLADVK